ncbi:MAG TPA: hypothetical protein VF759_01015 [Allosphingosinicella sp.]|jgi:hypothetical protein
MPPAMRIAGILAVLAATAAAAPASAEEWRLFHREKGLRYSEIGYVDMGSIERSGRTVRIAVRGFASRQEPPRPASVAMRLELDCRGRRVRALEARPLDSEDQLTHEIPIAAAAYRPLDHPAMKALARIACDRDSSATEALPAGTSLNSHATAELAALTPAPPPEPPEPSAEEIERLAAWAKERKKERFEDVIRFALTERCGTDPQCRQLEARIRRGIDPVVAVEAMQCSESQRGGFGQASCAFLVRHPRTGRTLSCTVEMAEAVGPHSRYWTYRTIAPPPPAEPPSKGSDLPQIPPMGESSLRCSGSPHALVSE